MRPLVLINDIHADTRTPSGRRDDWWAAIRAKLEHVLSAATKVNAAAILIAGDLFHAKTRVLGVWPAGTHEVVTFYLDWARRAQSSGIRVLVIPGNHDEVFDRLDSVPRQPLGALVSSGLFIDVSYRAEVFDGWCVSGVPYPDALSLSNLQRVPAAPAGTVGVLMLHCFAEKRATEFFGDPVHAYGEVTVPGYRVFHYGHDHSDHGVVEVGDTRHVQVGALGRGSLSGEEVHRRPQLVVVDASSALTVQPYALRVAPAEDVFDFEAKARRDAESSVVADFVTHLDALSSNVDDSLAVQIGALELPADIFKRVEGYIQRAEQEN